MLVHLLKGVLGSVVRTWCGDSTSDDDKVIEPQFATCKNCLEARLEATKAIRGF